MAYVLTVDHPDFPKGFKFDCDGIMVENGESRTLTEEDEIAFIARWGKDVKHFYGHGTVAKLSGSTELSKKQRDELMPEASTGAEVVAVETEAGDVVIVPPDVDPDEPTNDEGGD